MIISLTDNIAIIMDASPKCNNWKLYGLLVFIVLMTSCRPDSSLDNAGAPDNESLVVLVSGAKKPMPGQWIDQDTGHKVVRLVKRSGENRSFYFHNRPFLPAKSGDAWLMIFYGSTDTGWQLFSVDLQTGKIEQLTNSPGDKRGEIVAPQTRKVFYMQGDSVLSTHVDSRETELIYEFDNDIIGSVTTVNADETLLGGALITKKEREILKQYPQKSDFFERIYYAKLQRSLIVIDITHGEMTKVHTEKAWLNHIQFSPTDPDLLMYCHEGPWHLVDRIWNINIKTKENRLMHSRTVPREIAGHEFFSHDGQYIWFDLQIPRGETFYLAKRAVYSDETARYALKRNQWSIHFNLSTDQGFFAGDGGDPSQVAEANDGMWLYLFNTMGDSLTSEKLVNMKNHDYELEPNVHFSPDDRWVIFRANFEGTTQIYAVEIEKTSI